MIRLAVRVRRADAEVVLAELLELAPGGVEESEQGDVVEYAVYGAPGELPDLPDLEAAAGGSLVEVRTEQVADDWPERWKRFHQPIDVGGRLYVRPPWEPGLPAQDPRLDIVIDPGQAFGTGSHHTTRLCLELLLELDPAGEVVDLGCGSGVLAIAAAKLGFGPVRGLDHEPQSVEATLANAAANGVAVDAARADLRSHPIPAAPVVLANLLRPLLLTVAERMQRRPDALIASGLLRQEADEASAAFAARGLHEAARRESGEWSALLLTAKLGR